jgi:flavin reductase (DIM6/NTAB) family NADH-FMN oxidoreductase RutF
MAYLESSADGNSKARRMSAAAPEAAQEFEAAAFRHAMRELASGVALVTTGSGETRAGCTATAVCSLSLEPPSLIVSISRGSATLARLRANGVFGVSILAAGHEDLANRFSGRNGVSGAVRFAGENWITLATGAPLLRDALTAIDCEVQEIIERHTHAIVIGEVKALRRNSGAPALLHWRGQYQSLE